MAQAPAVLRMVMRRSLGLAAAGIAARVGAGRYLAKYLASLLFGVQPAETGLSGKQAVYLR